MASKWRSTTLGEVLRLQRGHDLPDQHRRPGPVPIMGSFGVTGWHDEARARGPGVTVGRSGGSIGVVSFTKTDYWPLNTCLYVTNFMGNDPRFCYYWLRTLDLAAFNSGSAQPSLNRNYIYQLPARIPMPSEQIAIADTLGSLDDLIELNNQTNKSLETMAGAIFRHWFVDFEFPNEEGKPYKSSSGDMIYNEGLGKEIPKDWNVSGLGGEVQIELGGTPDRTRAEFWNGDINWINSGKANEFRIVEPSEKITREGLDSSATKLLPKGTVVLAITGATLGQVSRLEIDSCANQSVIGIVENERMPSEYLYFWIKETINDLVRWQTGGAQQHINKGNVENSNVVVPSERIMQEYTEIARPIFEKISSLCIESQSLARIRDLLLPRIMSGRVRVPVEVR